MQDLQTSIGNLKVVMIEGLMVNGSAAHRSLFI